MSEYKPKCASCKIDTSKQLHTISDTLPEEAGHSYRICRCPECGGLRDEGQMDIRINSLRQIYDGCIMAMGELERLFNEQLDYVGITGDDLAEFLGIDPDEDTGAVIFKLSNYDLVRDIFLSHTGNAGGTSTSILMKKMGIEHDYIEFSFGEREEDDE